MLYACQLNSFEPCKPLHIQREGAEAGVWAIDKNDTDNDNNNNNMTQLV
jgi:hypothetical protein